MALVVVVAGLLAAGVSAAISLWTDSASNAGGMLSMMSVFTDLKSTEAVGALGLVAGLVVFTPLVVLLDRRTRAEWAKRPGFANRLAYKLPVYGALAVLLFAKLVVDVIMLSVVLQSLAYLGVSGAPDMGSLYLTQFVPALVAAIAFAVVGWYVFKLAKGKDMGDMFGNTLVVGSLALVIALLITAFVVLHGSTTQNATPDIWPALNNSHGNVPFQY
jgi:hypothetical protein